MDKIYRLNLINSVSGFKSANLIGSRNDHNSNLAIFSSVVHLGSNPPLLGMICRPSNVARHTLQNIEQTLFYTINHIAKGMEQRAHYTSAKFDEKISEFSRCSIQEEYINNFYAPFVKESPVQIGMKWIENIHIKANDTLLIVGEIQLLRIEEKAFKPDGKIDLNACHTLCISGLNNYHETNPIAEYPYARPSETPNFNS